MKCQYCGTRKTPQIEKNVNVTIESNEFTFSFTFTFRFSHLKASTGFIIPLWLLVGFVLTFATWFYNSTIK
jgi:hypothetical protein